MRNRLQHLCTSGTVTVQKKIRQNTGFMTVCDTRRNARDEPQSNSLSLIKLKYTPIKTLTSLFWEATVWENEEENTCWGATSYITIHIKRSSIFYVYNGRNRETGITRPIMWSGIFQKSPALTRFRLKSIFKSIFKSPFSSPLVFNWRGVKPMLSALENLTPSTFDCWQ